MKKVANRKATTKKPVKGAAKTGKPMTKNKPLQLNNPSVDQILTQAEAHRARTLQLIKNELSFSPMDELSEDAIQTRDFFEGFDLLPHWNFPQLINQVKTVYQHFIKTSPHPVDANYYEDRQNDLANLLMHLCYNRNLISKKQDELKMFANEVEQAAESQN